MTKNIKSRNKKTRNKKRLRFENMKKNNKTKKNKFKRIYGGEILPAIKNAAENIRKLPGQIVTGVKTGVNFIENKVKDKNQELKGTSFSEKNLGNKTLALGFGAANNTKNIIRNLSGSENSVDKKIRQNEQSIEVLEKEKENADENRKNEINEEIITLLKTKNDLEKGSTADISKGVGKLGEGINSFGKGFFKPSKKTKPFNDKEKEKIVKKLIEMGNKKELSKDEVNYLTNYLSQPESLLTKVNVSDTVGKTIRGIAEYMTEPDGNSETVITAALVPNYYDSYSKTTLPSEKDMKISESIFLINEGYLNSGDKIFENINGVDNFLAGVLNECAGAGCKNGQLPNFKSKQKITVTDNRGLIKNK